MSFQHVGDLSHILSQLIFRQSKKRFRLRYLTNFRGELGLGFMVTNFFCVTATNSTWQISRILTLRPVIPVPRWHTRCNVRHCVKMVLSCWNLVPARLLRCRLQRQASMVTPRFISSALTYFPPRNTKISVHPRTTWTYPSSSVRTIRYVRGKKCIANRWVVKLFARRWENIEVFIFIVAFSWQTYRTMGTCAWWLITETYAKISRFPMASWVLSYVPTLKLEKNCWCVSLYS